MSRQNEGGADLSGARSLENPMPSVIHLGLAGLMMLFVAACATAPAAVDPTPPPRRPDAKTQLEYGNPPPPGPRY
ncbi:hypothetical protein PMNALOAF_2080 [Methylobacterium adhaesivum]|jgi:hypothetical protein|nr:hypothetical protein PMNALOAF_2080 [Methylobacterium adhaesivum]